MTETQALYRQKLDRWRTYMQHYSLPDWDHLPDMELYIDQVVTLVCRYLELIPQDESNPLVTASSINNYVRLKVMPAPVKKRYSRRHLAYVLMICTLKQSMALTEIPKILPSELDEEAVRVMYNAFTARVSAATQTFITQVDAVADQELAEGNKADRRAVLPKKRRCPKRFVCGYVKRRTTQKAKALAPQANRISDK